VLEIGVFETYDMLYFDLEIYSSAPIKDMGRRTTGGRRFA